ncbi:MAG: hypothetical protein JWO06_3055, partial [Bacteroidota bacterium]|nr:hypothetical protein [Bacteroidota bacterium]
MKNISIKARTVVIVALLAIAMIGKAQSNNP